MIRRPPRSTLSSSSAASDVYKRQIRYCANCPTVGERHGHQSSYAHDVSDPHPIDEDFFSCPRRSTNPCLSGGEKVHPRRAFILLAKELSACAMNRFRRFHNKIERVVVKTAEEGGPQL